MPNSCALLSFLIPGFLLTIAIETPILLLGLSSRHAIRKKANAGIMLTACTYPIVVLVLPELLWPQFGYEIYLGIAETFAPVAECAIFYRYWVKSLKGSDRMRDTLQDFAAIFVANVVSWLGGGYIISRYLG